MKNGISLFFVQDSDRPLYLFAVDFAHALREWELVMRRENELAEGEAVPGPDGVQCIAGPDKVLQPAWRPPTDADADAEGCRQPRDRVAELCWHGCPVRMTAAGCWAVRWCGVVVRQQKKDDGGDN